MRLIKERYKPILILSFFLVLAILFGGTSYARAENIYDISVLIVPAPSSASVNPDNMVNLIIGAAVIVLVIFAGVALRRPKS